MGKITPFNKQNPVLWKQQNQEAIAKIYDDALKAIIKGILNLHELEHTGEWQHSRRRFDYSNSTFEIYLQHHTTWSLGMGSVLMRLKKLKKEINPLKKRRLKRP